MSDLLAEVAKHKPLPLYQCHKKVEALRIHAIHVYPDNVILEPERSGDYGNIPVTHEFFEKHAPKVGDYWVHYGNDYESISPASAFDAGYTLVDENPELSFFGIATSGSIGEHAHRRAKFLSETTVL